MLCEICAVKKSVFHIKQIIGKEIIELHLCESCASLRGIGTKKEQMDFSISNLLTDLVEVESTAKKSAKKNICKKCGFTLSKFKKSGCLGCSECYLSFSMEIRDLLEKMFSKTQHKGKYPKKFQAYKTFVCDIQSLKKKLENAISKEDYELAAILRDRINEMRESVKKDGNK